MSADAVAEPSGTETRRGVRENDTLYRRPPAHPPVESTTGGSWFTGGTELPDESEPAEPQFGPAPPSTSGRTSFGFTAGPISPVRSSGGTSTGSRRPTSPAGPDADELPIRQQGAPASRHQSPPDRQPGTSTGRRPGTSTDRQPGARRPTPPPPAARQAAPAMTNWPPPARLTPDQSTLERVPAGESDPDRALRTPSGEYAGWQVTPSGEYAGWQSTDSTGEFAGWQSTDSTGERHQVHHEAPAEPLEPPRQSRLVTVGIVLLSAIVLIGGAVVGVAYFSGSDDPDSVLQLGSGSAGKRTVSAPLDNRTKASFELLAGANTVHLSIGELGDDLFRISTPDDAGIKPSPTIRNDDVKLQVTRDGDGTGGEIEVVLAAKVRWALRFSGYAETQVIDVSGGQVSQIEMVAGMRKAEVTLSKPSGTVPMKINGAVDQLVLKSPAGSPVRIKVGGGAQTVLAGSRTLKDVAAGSTITPKGWDTANRYDVTAGARITALTIENA